MAGRPRLLPFYRRKQLSGLRLSYHTGFRFDESGNQERVLLAAFQSPLASPEIVWRTPQKTVFVTSTQLAPSLL
jgi:hypothetical protein